MTLIPEVLGAAIAERDAEAEEAQAFFDGIQEPDESDADSDVMTPRFEEATS